MENASKALIIAGSILVSIMIIGFGVIILNNVRDVMDPDLDPTKAQANNEPFTSLFKTNASASDVKGLVRQVSSNNINAENDKGGVGYIYLLFGTDVKTPTEVSKAVKNGKRYTIDTPNDKSLSEKKFLSYLESAGGDEESIDMSAAYGNDDSAFYYNGFLRVISITENS